MSYSHQLEPASLLTSQIKLRGSLNDRLVVWWIRATHYAVVNEVLTPLYNLLNGSFQRFVRVSEDCWRIRVLELGYFTDLHSGEQLASFRNPFTGETGECPDPVLGPNEVSLTPAGLQGPENFPFGSLRFSGQLGPGYTDGEDLWIREDTLVQMESDHPAFGNYTYNELVTYRGRLADVQNDAIVSPDAMLSYTTVSNWRPWMKAGDTPGHILANGSGRKVADVDDLPADFLAIARQQHPALIADPAAMLDAPPPA